MPPPSPSLPFLSPLLLAILFRLVNALLIRTFFNPDEYWQAPEVAYHLVFGRGYLTWEWRQGARLRSYLHPLVFAILFKLLQRRKDKEKAGVNVVNLSGTCAFALMVYQAGGMDTRWAVAYGPSLVQAIWAGLGDWYTYKLVARVWTPSVAYWSLLSQLCCWFNVYSMTRTFSSSFEATLVTAALYHWVAVWEHVYKGRSHDDDDTPCKRHLPPRLISRDEGVALLLGSMAVFIRPTGIILWVPLGLWRLAWTRGPFRYLMAYVLPLCGAIWLWAVCVDRWGYGVWTLTPYNFFRFNILKSKASLYGTHPWHWYLSQGLPAVLGPLVPLLLLGSGQYKRKPLVTTTVFLIVWYMLGLSLSAHKEFRFLLPVLPLCTGLAGLGAYQLNKDHGSSWALPSLAKALLVMNLPIAWYLGRYHQRGPIDVMDYLAARLAHDSITTNHTIVDFLVPCHSTPFYSYLHLPSSSSRHQLDLWMLDCSPEARLSPHGSDTDQFLASPRLYLTTRYSGMLATPSNQKADGLPHYLVLFNSAASQLGPQLTSWGYELVASFFYSSFKGDRDALNLENSLKVFSRRGPGTFVSKQE